MIDTKLTPTEIIGRENMQALKKHLQLSIKHGGEFPAAALNKEVGNDARGWVAKILEVLRREGFYPLDVNEKGIVWGVATKSRVQMEMENGLRELRLKSRAELQQMGRDGYREVRRQQGGFDRREAPPGKWEAELVELV